jgi:hypothetical protein
LQESRDASPFSPTIKLEFITFLLRISLIFKTIKELAYTFVTQSVVKFLKLKVRMCGVLEGSDDVPVMFIQYKLLKSQSLQPTLDDPVVLGIPVVITNQSEVISIGKEIGIFT